MSIFIFLILFHSVFFSFDMIQNVEVELFFEGENANAHVKRQIEIGPRIPGSKESNACLNYFIREFNKINTGFFPIVQQFTVNNVSCRNLLFKLNLQEPNIIILAAHYDSRARATKDESAPEAPVPGANDGASGCAVLLELARVLKANEKNLECQIWFLFF
ncbi:MAG: M28 family peptidase [Promethearchaeota archaeon]